MKCSGCSVYPVGMFSLFLLCSPKAGQQMLTAKEKLNEVLDEAGRDSVSV